MFQDPISPIHLEGYTAGVCRGKGPALQLVRRSRRRAHSAEEEYRLWSHLVQRVRNLHGIPSQYNW